MFEALGVQAVEINAQLPLKQFRALITGLFDSTDKVLNLQDSGVMQSALMGMH